jgi:hypothetical protein
MSSVEIRERFAVCVERITKRGIERLRPGPKLSRNRLVMVGLGGAFLAGLKFLGIT